MRKRERVSICGGPVVAPERLLSEDDLMRLGDEILGVWQGREKCREKKEVRNESESESLLGQVTNKKFQGGQNAKNIG